jgi:hypothetical protein
MNPGMESEINLPNTKLCGVARQAEFAH